MAGLAVKIAMEPPIRLLSVMPDAPPELEGVIFKCLAKNPAERYPNVAELVADLEPFSPKSREHVERVQRLVFGTTSPPRDVPSAPSLRRLASEHSNTLGPVDGDDASSPAIAAPPPRMKSAWPLALGVGVALAVVGITGVALLARRGNPPVTGEAASSTAAVLAPGPSARAVASVLPAPPPEAVPVDSAAAALAPSATPKHHAISVERPPRTHSTAKVHATPTASSATIITGISRDRK